MTRGHIFLVKKYNTRVNQYSDVHSFKSIEDAYTYVRSFGGHLASLGKYPNDHTFVIEGIPYSEY